eukprot:GFUD01029998.1.p1 GENE.GFUD01029998.1~~GFUD01029998.1.p1  ORF type:complete len:215 (-),score=22.53 GFUD01029998.1:62-706(-)
METKYLILLVVLSCFLCSMPGDLINEKSSTSLSKFKSGQHIFVGLEIGIPYDLANTLSNPLARTLTSLSVLGIGAFFLMGLLIVPYHMVSNLLDPFATFEAPGRKKRATGWNALPNLLHLKDGFWFLQEGETSCRKRVVCEVHQLLLDSPRIIQSLVKFFTKKLHLGPFFRSAVHTGLTGQKCHQIYWRCRKSNFEILSQVFPHIRAGRRGSSS